MSKLERKKWIEEAISKKHIKCYDYKDFSNFEVIGTGRHGNHVYRAKWKNPRIILALKSLKDLTAEKIAYEFKIQREVQFHDNIIHFHGITIENPDDHNSKRYMLVMEYAEGGALRKYLEENIDNLTWSDKFKMAKQLASAVSCLHDENIIHRDLHSNNILVHQNNIKLADFGLSKMVDDPSTSQGDVRDAIPYADPQKFARDSYSLNKKSDVYSIGVLLWEISSCQLPFRGNNEFRLSIQILQGLRETPVLNTPKDYEKIYTDCWKHEPNDRPTIQNVVTGLEEIMAKYNITTKNGWTPYIDNSSYNNLSQSFNNNISNTKKAIPLKSPNKVPQTSFYKQKSKKDIVDGIASLADHIYNENKRQRILDYLKDNHALSTEIFDWLSNNQSEANSLLVLGDFHYLGIAAMVDKRKAFDYYVRAGNEGSSVAQYNLGVLCEKDDDVYQAIYWFNKSAEQGNQDAINDYYRLNSSNNKTYNPENLHSVMGAINHGNLNERKNINLQDFKFPFVHY